MALHRCGDTAGGTLIALFEARRSGRGQRVEVSAQRAKNLASFFNLQNLRVGHSQYYSFPANHVLTEEQAERMARLGTKFHRLVWHHESGRTSLVLGTSAVCVEGMDAAEGKALIAWLQAWMTKPEYVYHHEWRMGDVLMWDNTGTLHRVLPYDRDCGRRLHRVTLLGEESLTEMA